MTFIVTNVAILSVLGSEIINGLLRGCYVVVFVGKRVIPQCYLLLD